MTVHMLTLRSMLRQSIHGPSMRCIDPTRMAIQDTYPIFSVTSIMLDRSDYNPRHYHHRHRRCLYPRHCHCHCHPRCRCRRHYCYYCNYDDHFDVVVVVDR